MVQERQRIGMGSASLTSLPGNADIDVDRWRAAVERVPDADRSNEQRIAVRTTVNGQSPRAEPDRIVVLLLGHQDGWP